MINKMGIDTLIWIVIVLGALRYTPVNGSFCRTSRDCREYEFCYKNYCDCASGFVRFIQKCLPEKKYGEQCQHDIQCNRGSMICTNDENDIRNKRFCYCDSYHLWNSTLQECVEIDNLSLAGNFREVHNVTGILEKSAQKVFFGVVIAGVISVSVLLSFIGICSVYGCCDKHKKGRYGEDSKNNQVNEVAVVGLPEGTYEALDTDFSAMDF